MTENTVKFYKKIDSEYYIKSVKVNSFIYIETQLDLEKFNYTCNYGVKNFQQVTVGVYETTPEDMSDYEEITLEEWNKAVDNLSKTLKS